MLWPSLTVKLRFLLCKFLSQDDSKSKVSVFDRSNQYNRELNHLRMTNRIEKIVFIVCVSGSNSLVIQRSMAYSVCHAHLELKVR